MKKKVTNRTLSPANSKANEKEIVFTIKLKESIYSQLEYLSNVAKERKSIVVRAMIKREYKRIRAKGENEIQ